MKALLPLLTIALAACTAKTEGTEPAAVKAPATEVAAEGKAPLSYAQLLKKHVKDGRVDYKALGEQDGASIDVLVQAIAVTTLPAEGNEALGFYIDAYNTLVMNAVLKNERPRSVLDVKGFFDKAEHTVAGKKVTLDALEKKVINPFAKDPRTHFVLVCGAVGCPILEDKPFAGDNIDKRMDAATRRYLSGPTGARVSSKKLELSMIFNWYKDDFGGEAGVLEFVKRHLSDEQVALLGDNPTVSFVDYNWTLNQQ